MAAAASRGVLERPVLLGDNARKELWRVVDVEQFVLVRGD
jgi:hypothetical protein